MKVKSSIGIINNLHWVPTGSSPNKTRHHSSIVGMVACYRGSPGSNPRKGENYYLWLKGKYVRGICSTLLSAKIKHKIWWVYFPRDIRHSYPTFINILFEEVICTSCNPFICGHCMRTVSCNSYFYPHNVYN